MSKIFSLNPITYGRLLCDFEESQNCYSLFCIFWICWKKLIADMLVIPLKYGEILVAYSSRPDSTFPPPWNALKSQCGSSSNTYYETFFGLVDLSRHRTVWRHEKWHLIVTGFILKTLNNPGYDLEDSRTHIFCLYESLHYKCAWLDWSERFRWSTMSSRTTKCTRWPLQWRCWFMQPTHSKKQLVKLQCDRESPLESDLYTNLYPGHTDHRVGCWVWCVNMPWLDLLAENRFGQ